MTVECHSDGFDKLLIFNDLQANRERPKSSRILAKRLLAGQERPAPKRGQSRGLSWKSFVTCQSQRERQLSSRRAGLQALFRFWMGEGGLESDEMPRGKYDAAISGCREGKGRRGRRPGGSFEQAGDDFRRTRRTCHGAALRGEEARGFQPLRLRVIGEHVAAALEGVDQPGRHGRAYRRAALAAAQTTEPGTTLGSA